MTRIVAVLALMAALAAVATIGGPLLNSDRHEEISLPAVRAWPTFAHGVKESKP